VLLTISHETRYGFEQGIAHGLQRLRLRPKVTHGQEILGWAMELEGAVLEVEYEDHNHNCCDLISIKPGATEVVVTCRGSVRTTDNNGIIGMHSGHMPLWCFLRPTKLTRAGPKVRALVTSLAADKADTLGFLHTLSAAILDQVEYVPGSTGTETSAEQALAAGKGVCQDHAHIMISAGRLLDIPMRYVGGYLKLDETDEQEAGHGWAEAHVADLGWVGFDVSNQICPDERYVRVATGCDYSEAAPVTSITMGGGDTSLDVHLSVAEGMVGQQQQQSSESGSQQQSQDG
jgi:transglutaminase-like putative cysteine protease